MDSINKEEIKQEDNKEQIKQEDNDEEENEDIITGNEWIGCPLDVHPQQGEYPFDDFIIDSKFDEGNIMNVSKMAPFHYEMYVAPDCYQTSKQTNGRTWFYFRIKNIKNSGTYEFTIRNLNNQRRLFNDGLLPVFKSIPSSPIWKTIQAQLPRTDLTEKGMELSFKFDVDKSEEEIYIAYTWPWSYEQDQKQLNEYEEKLKNDDEIYFHRELVITTRENRRIDLLTISSKTKMLEKRENLIPNLFPNSTSEQRPFTFHDKKYVFISARVHAGENSSSFVFHGLVKFLLNKEDIRAKAVRDNFVFVMIPCLNPDGVYRGQYRVDPLGQNLNRFYINPDLKYQPSIYAARQIVLEISESKQLFLYVDLHSHATKKGTFVYGNSQPYREQVEYRMFPKILSLNSRYFDYEACNFSEKNLLVKKEGMNREGAGRVALSKATGLIQFYTLECNYANGPLYNILRDPLPKSNSSLEEEKSDIKDIEWHLMNNDFELPKNIYNPKGFEEIGEGIAISCLDLCDINPLSRVKSSVYKNLRNIKLHIALGLLKEPPFKYDPFLRKISRNLEKNLDALLLYLDSNIKKNLDEINEKELTAEIEKEKQQDQKAKKEAKSKLGSRPVLKKSSSFHKEANTSNIEVTAIQIKEIEEIQESKQNKQRNHSASQHLQEQAQDQM